jgi:hypothetical protein
MEESPRAPRLLLFFSVKEKSRLSWVETAAEVIRGFSRQCGTPVNAPSCCWLSKRRRPSR